MLNADVLLQVFEECDLETCVALSRTCSLNYGLFKRLDQNGVLQNKVQKRVPWFKLGDSGTQTWSQCAILLVERSRRSLNPANENLYLIKDLKVAVSLGRNDVEIMAYTDLQKNDELRLKLQPLFEGELISSVADDDVVLGASLAVPETQIDLRTMVNSASLYEGPIVVDFSEYSNCDTSPSGLVVRHESAGEFVRVMDENDKLLHVRFSKGDRKVDTLIFKERPYCDRNADGAYIIRSTIFPQFLDPLAEGYDDLEPDEIDGCLVNLLPGAQGALVIASPSRQGYRQMVGYVEPVYKLPTVLICTVPTSSTYLDGYTGLSTRLGSRFWTTYDGYLFVIFAGRFFRLWVDLGYRSEMSETSKIDDTLSECVLNRCLTVWDRDFPVLGSFAEVITSGRGIQISRGCGEGFDRYVTCSASCGSGFGDLATGKTFFCEMGNPKVMFPYVDNGLLGFAGLGENVSIALVEAMERMPMGTNLTGLYRELCSEAEEVGETLTIRNDFDDLRDLPRRASEEVRDFEMEQNPYDDSMDLDEEPKLYRFFGRDLPPFDLNPTTMNCPQAFKSVDCFTDDPVMFYWIKDAVADMMTEIPGFWTRRE